MKRYDIINQFIQARGYTRFLEIGTDQGETYKRVIAPIRISVDPNPASMATYRIDSDAFFALTNDHDNAEYNMQFDIIFIDGLHTHDQAYRDINNAISVSRPGGIIIVHDCLPTSEKMQLPLDHYPGGEWTGDVWKAFVKIRSELNFETYTVDQDFGCGVIDLSRKKSSRVKLPSDMDAMTYDDFVNNRDKWMNVKEDILID